MREETRFEGTAEGTAEGTEEGLGLVYRYMDILRVSLCRNDYLEEFGETSPNNLAPTVWSEARSDPLTCYIHEFETL